MTAAAEATMGSQTGWGAACAASPTRMAGSTKCGMSMYPPTALPMARITSGPSMTQGDSWIWEPVSASPRYVPRKVRITARVM